tara:strand:- start:2071 stop:2862 length:792 start_codon:yes stop_codon:yes gene_type:complete
MIDSHCHLNFDSIKDDFKNIISRAKDNGVTCILSINTRIKDFQEHYELINNYNSLFISFGIHPSNVDEDNLISVEKIISLSNREKVIAIGETGLDFYLNENNVNNQIISFENHIESSYKTGLPLIIHQRNSEEKIMEILEFYQKKESLKVVFHCFTGSSKLRDFCLDNNYYISLSGIVTFKNAQELRNTISNVPIENILIETDSPFLAPVPKRGKSNEPSYVFFIAEYLSNFYQISFEEFNQIIDNNFYKLFSKAKRYNQISL